MKKIALIIALSISFFTNAQHGRRDGNRIGISGGVTHTTLLGTNFNVTPDSGWIGGLSVRGNYYNNWSMTFGMQFTESHFNIESVNILAQKQAIKYKMAGAQVKLLFSYNLVKNHVSLDFGPVLQVSDKMKIDQKFDNNLLLSGDNVTAVRAIDIVDMTKINGNLYAGLSAGTRRVRAVAFYQYGVNNLWNRLNQDEDLLLKNGNKNYKAHIGMLSGQLLINL